MKVRVNGLKVETRDITVYDLCRDDGSSLPAFDAGAHIELTLPNGLKRQYSLVPSGSSAVYRIAVQRDRASRGGSAWIHENFVPGCEIDVSEPRNHFRLDEQASRSILIAGGIGVTPMLGMCDRLDELGSSWRLYYAARSRSAAAFLPELEGKAILHFDDEHHGTPMDMKAIVACAMHADDLYCCGPAPMLDAFVAAVAERGGKRVHVERFAGAGAKAVEGAGFDVALARSGRRLYVPAGKTILSVLKENGVEIEYSCQDGVCGACMTHVVEGVPDHRDMVLSSEEQASNTKIMVCCSRSKSDLLILDL